MEAMKTRLLELQLSRTQLLIKYEPSYRQVQEIDQEIAEAGMVYAVRLSLGAVTQHCFHIRR